jgi:hypothetical protein
VTRPSRPQNNVIPNPFSEPWLLSTEHPQQDLPTKSTKEKRNHTACLPYIQNTTHYISRLLKKQGIHSTEISQQNGVYIQILQGCTIKKKVWWGGGRGSIYKIPYSSHKVYIFQSGLHNSTRISEHIRDTTLVNPSSVVAKHSTALSSPYPSSLHNEKNN